MHSSGVMFYLGLLSKNACGFERRFSLKEDWGTGNKTCASALYGYGEEYEGYIYIYSRYDRGKIPAGSVFIVPLLDYELLVLEFPDFFTDNREEYNFFDKNNLFTVYGGNSSMFVLGYGVFLRWHTTSRFAQVSDISLKLLYSKYNRLYFNGELPCDVAVIWNERASGRAGCYKTKKRGMEIGGLELSLSLKYHQRFSGEVESVLLHEMIHVALPVSRHDSMFMAMCDKLTRLSGIKVQRYSKGKGSPNWVYQCVGCGVSSERIKRIKNIATCHCNNCRSRFVEYSYGEWEDIQEYN